MKVPESPYIKVGCVYKNLEGKTHLILRVSPNFEEEALDEIYVGIPLVEEKCFDAFVFMRNGQIVSPKGNTHEVSPLNLDLSSGKSWIEFFMKRYSNEKD